MRHIRSGDLVAASMPPGPAWFDLLRAAWDVGAAVLPLDHRLPKAASDRILAAGRPTLVLRGGEARRGGGVDVEPGLALVMPTSGTTGEPKLVEITHDALSAAVAASAERLQGGADDAWLACLPVGHIGGMLVLSRGLLLDAPIVFHPEFDVAAFERAVVAGVRFTSIVPTMLGRLLHAGMNLSPLKAILVGGAAMTQDRGGAPVVTTYGMTETCGGVVYDGIPLDGVEVRIGGDDRIEINGPMLFRGYRSAHEPTRTAGGWFATGDAGSIDDGKLRVFGRLDDLIITGGHKVWPAEVESALRLDPSVAEVKVSGYPDPEWGTRVVAVVVPADPSAPPTLEHLRERIGEELPRYKAPRQLVLVDSLSGRAKP
jgi:o-succinylbenzoate---CoA ligase